MIRQALGIVTLFMLIVVIGCSATRSLPGAGGKGDAQKMKAGHPDIPEGVNCYVCHKGDIPEQAFHDDYGTMCDKCHGKTTWMAYKYPHEKWELGIHRKMRCNQCHSAMETFDFTVWQCWGCHHIEDETVAYHKELGFEDIDNCIMCHKGTPEKRDESESGQ